MRSICRLFIAITALLLSATAFADENGQQYREFNPPLPISTGNKIEVLEFFSYGCHVCYDLHPYLSAWIKKMPKDVQIDFVPVSFYPQWEPAAYTYYALDAMNKRKQLDDALYEAWHNKAPMNNVEDIAAFVAQHGVDRQQFTDQYNGMFTRSKFMRSMQLSQTYQIDATPTLVVDGKYVLVGLAQINNEPHPEETIRQLNQLIDKARKERKERGKH